MELKDIILKKGDIITYSHKLGNETGKYTVRANDDNSFDDEYLKCFDVLKIERPKYEIIYEAPKEILDREEKEYLENFLRPFKNRVEWIAKRESYKNDEYIGIKVKDEPYFELPDFKKDMMYKGMELGKEYSLKELGLFEGE